MDQNDDLYWSCHSSESWDFLMTVSVVNKSWKLAVPLPKQTRIVNYWKQRRSWSPCFRLFKRSLKWITFSGLRIHLESQKLSEVYSVQEWFRKWLKYHLWKIHTKHLHPSTHSIGQGCEAPWLRGAKLHTSPWAGQGPPAHQTPQKPETHGARSPRSVAGLRGGPGSPPPAIPLFTAYKNRQ